MTKGSKSTNQVNCNHYIAADDGQPHDTLDDKLNNQSHLSLLSPAPSQLAKRTVMNSK